MKTALIVDPDLSFGFWLSRGFDRANYQSFPAKSVADASALLDELRIEVHLLIVNPTLPNAAALIESLRRLNEHLRVVALIGEQPNLPTIATRVDLCCRKPDRPDDVTRRQWIEHVEELLPVSLLGAAFENSALMRKCAGALVWHARKRDVPAAAKSTGPMVRAWKQWEGRLLDHRFRLDRHLGSSDHSAVFLTHRGEAAQPAAIKVVLAESADREILLPQWARAAELSHPSVVRLFHLGSCESQGVPLLYLVMEYAEENLGEVLRQRPLTPSEARQMLDPVLDALAYIHGRGLVHGRVKPSNILAVGDHLKISSDQLHPAGNRAPRAAQRGVYDPPESTNGLSSPAGDVWSLGITLVEALTQRPLLAKRPRNKPPALPANLPPLLLDIANHCLQPDPARREIAAHLVDGLRKASSLDQNIKASAMATPPRRSSGIWRYALPAAVIGLALSGILVGPLHRTIAVVSAVPPPPTVPAAAKPAPPVDPPSPPVPEEAPPPAPPAEPLLRRVTEQVLPEISQTAKATIQGMIEVSVRVRVDSSGNVVDARLDSPGPSHYFASRAIQAARQWKFEPLPGNSQAPPEEWILRFDFTKTGTETSGARVTP